MTVYTRLLINGSEAPNVYSTQVYKATSESNSSSHFTSVVNNYAGSYAATYDINDLIEIYADKAEILPLKSPVAQFKMNDNASNTTVIESISANNGTSQKNTDLMSTTGKINKALHFNGVVGGNLISHWKLNGDATDSSSSHDGTLSTPTIIDSMDSTSGWATTSNTFMSVNQNNFQEGTGAINVYNTVLGSDLGISKSISATDYSGKVITYYLYVTQDVIDHWDGGIFYLFDGTGAFNRYYIDTANLKAGWNVEIVDVDNPSSSSGTPDMTAVTRLKFAVEGQQPINQIVPEGSIVVDFINYGTPMKTKNMLNEDNHAYRFIGKEYTKISIPSMNVPTEGTISFWIKAEGTQVSNNIYPVGYNQKFALLGPSGGVGRRVGIIVRNSADSSFKYYDWADETSLDPFDGQWHMYTISWKNNDYIYCWVDGISCGNKKQFSDVYFPTNISFNIGSWSSTYGSLNGKIDDIRLYDRKLDDYEVASTYNDGVVTYETSDYVTFNPIYMTSNNHAVSFWYKTTKSYYQTILQQANGTTSGYVSIKPSINAIIVESKTNNLWQHSFATGINVDDGVWHHYCVVFSPTDTRLYTDGVLSDTYTENIDTALFKYGVIGGYGNTTYTYGETPNGDLDDIRIYDSAITDFDVHSIYNFGDGTEEPNNNFQKIFSGILETMHFKGSANKEQIVISGKDYTTRLIDRSVEPEVYNALPAGSIVKDIIGKYTDDITFNNVQDSSTIIKRITFNHSPVFDAIKELANQADYVFYVDNNKDLHFEPKSDVSSGKTFDNTNVLKATTQEERKSVFNEIWVYGDRYLDGYQESFTGTGSTSDYTLIYKPHNTDITVDGVQKKGAIKGMAIDNTVSGVDYTVNFHDKMISFQSGTSIGYSAIPGSNADVVINYKRNLPIVKVGKDNNSIAKYGKRVKVIEDKNIKDPDSAQELLAAELATYSQPPKEVSLAIKGIVDVVPSNTCIVNIPYHNIDNKVYDIVEATFDFNPSTLRSENVLKMKVNKKIMDTTDTMKQMILDIKKLQGADISDADILTRFEFTTGSIGIRQSGVTVYSNTITQSGLYCYWDGGDTNVTGTLASGTLQRGVFGVGNGSPFSEFQAVWSGGYF